MSQIFVNNAKTTSTAVVGAGDLFIPVLNASKFPILVSPDYVLATLESEGSIEIVKIIGKSGNILEVEAGGRGQEGTFPLNFPSGTRVESRITAASINLIRDTSSGAISTEVASRIAADITLQNDITAEAALRATETADRIAADALKAPIASPTFTGQVKVPSGTSSVPGLAFSSDSAYDTGFYHIAEGSFGIACNATPVVTFGPTGLDLLGTPTAPTATTGTNTTQIATTQFVQTSKADRAPINSPAFTGTPTAPTPAGASNDTSIATTAFVKTNDATKAPLNSPNFTGVPTAPTATNTDYSGQLANTAWVRNRVAPTTYIFSIPLSGGFTSYQAHSFGAGACIVGAVLQCIGSADAGYDVGDEVSIASYYSTDGAIAHTLWINSLYVGIRVWNSTNFFVYHKTSLGNIVFINTARWRILIRVGRSTL